MSANIVTLCYRKIIDAKSVHAWDKLVFEDSYTELKMQAQYFNQEKKYKTFAGLLHSVPAAARLHFLVSASVIGYIRQLNEQVPDILNILGKQCLTFKNFQFEIVNSDFQNSAAHQVAISFFTEPLIWHDTPGGYLLLSDAAANTEHAETFMLKIQPFLSIHTLKT